MNKIFISYSHQDERWKDMLVRHLKVLEMEGYFQLWDDRQIQLGHDWLPEIETALNTADVAIMMISADFLTSNFIRNQEVPRLLERRIKEGIVLIPFIVKPCPWQEVEWLASIQAFPKDGVPLMKGSEYEIEENLSKLARKINQIIKSKTVVTPEHDTSREVKAKSLKDTVLITGLPKREIHLIGRKQELQLLEERLAQTGLVLLVNGLGGIGKTEVCKTFFMEHYKEFSYAGWIDYVSSIKESLVNSIDAELVKCHEKDTLDERFNKIISFLQHLPPDSLLVIDNIEDPADEDLDKIKTLPFKVIANSRLNLDGFDNHTLDFLSADCCKALFYERYKGQSHDEFVEKIVELCGRHTLTVELLARTAQNAALPVKKLYDQLVEKGFNLNDVIVEKVGTFWHNEKTKKQFFHHLLKIFDLSNVTDSELVVLTNLSVLPAIYISQEKIKEWIKLETMEDINSLAARGWLRQEGFTIFMHQVVGEVIRHRALPDVKKCKNLIVSLANKLHLDPVDNPIDKKEFVPFADSLLSYIEEKDKELAVLSNNLSHIYLDLGQLEKALEFQEKDVEISEQVLDKNHPSLATSYNNLSLIYQDLGQLEKALEFQEKSVKIKEAVLDKNHPSLATSYNNLSTIYKDLGQLEKALEFQEKDIKIREAVLDKNHPSLATSYNNLSLIYKDLGQLEKALEFQLKSLKIREKVLDKNHPDLATSYHNLSAIYFDIKDYPSAFLYEEKAVAILQRLFPNGHPNLDTAKNNLEEIKRAME